MEVEGKYLYVTECNFEEILNREKTFEIRKVSEGIETGDTVAFIEFDESTGEPAHRYLIIKIGETHKIENNLIMSLILLTFIDDKGIVHDLMNKKNLPQLK